MPDSSAIHLLLMELKILIVLGALLFCYGCDFRNTCPPKKPGSIFLVERYVGVKSNLPIVRERLLETLSEVTLPMDHVRVDDGPKKIVFYNPDQRFCGIYLMFFERGEDCFLINIKDQTGGWTPQSSRFLDDLNHRLDEMGLSHEPFIRVPGERSLQTEHYQVPQIDIDTYCSIR